MGSIISLLYVPVSVLVKRVFELKECILIMLKLLNKFSDQVLNKYLIC